MMEEVENVFCGEPFMPSFGQTAQGVPCAAWSTRAIMQLLKRL